MTDETADLLAHEIDVGMRELVANVLRVMAGAGRPHAIAGDVLRLALAISKYSTLEADASALLYDVLGGLLEAEQHREQLKRYEAEGRFFNPEHLRWDGDKSHALDSIQTGVLRMLASRMLGQLPQERAGEDYLFRGCRELEQYFVARSKRIAR